jgi:predicted HTH domain antitoxin
MTAATAVISQADRITALRRREAATAAAVQAIDEKLARLTLARRVRAVALNRIRCELARENEPVAPDCHEHR